MKIAVPVDSGNSEAKINQAFARAPYFYIFDSEKKEGIYVDNAASLQSGGAGIKAAQLLADNVVDVLLTPKCGENAVNVLKEANIKIYKSVGDDVAGNISAFDENELIELTEIESGHHK